MEIKIWQIISIVVCLILGTLLHFTYEWSHHNKVVAYFSAVNESTWEHIKIALTPTFIYTIIDLIPIIYKITYKLFISKVN